MSYAELSTILGVELESAKRRVLRSGWVRRQGNDGRVRVAVPLTVVGGNSDESGKEAGRSRADSPDGHADVSPLALRMVAAAEAQAEAARLELVQRDHQLAAVREALARQEGEAAGLREAVRVAEAAVFEARERTTRAEQMTREVSEALAEARAQFAKADAEAQAAYQQRADAQRQVEALQGEVERLRRRGWWGRLLNR